MKLSGNCDFCKKDFKDEGFLMTDRGVNFLEVMNRPCGIAAIFPFNRRELSNTCNFSEASLKQHKITTRACCAGCMRPTLYLTEIGREYFGNDSNAINRHGCRYYVTNTGKKVTIDRVLDIVPQYFQISEPVSFDHYGTVPQINLDLYQHSQWTWNKAIQMMLWLLNAKMLSPIEFFEKHAKKVDESESTIIYRKCSMTFMLGKGKGTVWSFHPSHEMAS